MASSQPQSLLTILQRREVGIEVRASMLLSSSWKEKAMNFEM